MKSLHKIILAIAFFSLILSCKKEVEVQLPESKYQIVMNCIMSEDSLFTVSVTRSKKLYVDDNANINITNATVSIYENGVFVEDLKHIYDDVYQSPTFKPTNGKEYKVVIKANGYTNAEATETLIKQASISNVVYQENALIKQTDTLSKISFDIADPIGVKNYYELQVLYIFKYEDPNSPTDSTRTVQPISVLIQDQELKENFTPDIDGNTDYSTDNLQFSDKYIDGKNYKVNAFLYPIFTYHLKLDSFIVNVKSVSKSYYDYKQSVLQQLYSDGPFSEPVRVYTNVKGGVGILGSYSQVKAYFKQ
jgi:biopolymer transport protein ExbD